MKCVRLDFAPEGKQQTLPFFIALTHAIITAFIEA